MDNESGCSWAPELSEFSPSGKKCLPRDRKLRRALELGMFECFQSEHDLTEMTIPFNSKEEGSLYLKETTDLLISIPLGKNNCSRL